MGGKNYTRLIYLWQATRHLICQRGLESRTLESTSKEQVREVTLLLLDKQNMASVDVHVPVSVCKRPSRHSSN